ncbi:hypothetical protein HPB47_024867 [Ixodes persulcatus]|uniref:Uncharacterized protein n=1 Tax=Ixodes persulcatus TaxID=34615 RepID=A0AC60Q352_IXOPE|nr:hypothetical protein HPB47_024867 [Ixodes persulcatus]
MEEMPCEDWTPTRYSRLCSAHFEDDCFHQRGSRRYLRKGSVPTKFDFPALTSERSPRKRQRAKSHVGTLQRQQRKQRHRSPPPVRQPGSSTTQPSPGEAPEASAATGPGSSAKSTLETMPEYLSVRCHEASVATGTGRTVNIVDNIFTDTMRNLVLRRSRKSNNMCADDVRKFALTVHFYSAKAYKFLRKQVRLPHPSALRKWGAVIDGNPGFTRESFNRVTQEAQKGRLLVSLMVGEMSIKKQVDWDGKEVIGYCDQGHGILNNDCVAYAKHVLVFLAVAVNKSWKIPLGYALIHGLDGSIRANIVRQYITKLEEAGAECISVTCDGTNCNISMLTALGVCFAPPLRSWFPNPSDPSRKVYGLLDACHMLKLMRNLLAEKQCIRDGAGRVVAWKYLEALGSLQQQEGLHAANKLRKKHIDFQRQKMKVSLAAQTLSRSVSCALLFYKEKGIRGFEGVEATAEFAAAVDNIFDLSNSCHPLGRGSKVPVRAVNKDIMLRCIDQASHYLRGLKDFTCQPLSQGARKTPILGFLLVLESIKGLAEDLVWGPSPPLRTGNNDNPTALEFRSAYRKCLVASVQPSTRGNCQVDGTATLFVSSSGCHQQVQARDEAAMGEGTHETNSYQSLSQFAECVVEYIAGDVAVNFAKVTKCPENSRIALVTSDKRGLVLAKDAGVLHSPSWDVLHLRTIAEKVLRRNFDKAAKGRNWLLMLQTEIMGIASKTPLFRTFDHLFLAQTIDHHSHCAIMMKTMLEYYFKLRIHDMCRQLSAAEKGLVL